MLPKVDVLSPEHCPSMVHLHLQLKQTTDGDDNVSLPLLSSHFQHNLFQLIVKNNHLLHFHLYNNHYYLFTHPPS